MKLIAELQHFLRSWSADLRRACQWSNLNDAAAATAIVHDIACGVSEAGRHTYAAEQADREAARLIRQSLEDGRIVADEIPVLRAALRHIDNSARHDEQATRILV